MSIRYYRLVFLCAILVGCNSDTMIDQINVTSSGKECRVFFFKNWGTYSHPVKPVDPISYEEALLRDGFSRAWMCGPPEDQKFVLFEGIRISRVEIAQSDARSSFYEAIDIGGAISLGKQLKASETLNRNSFIFVDLTTDVAKSVLVEPTLMLKFEYEYDAKNGALKKVTTTNASGDVKILDY